MLSAQLKELVDKAATEEGLSIEALPEQTLIEVTTRNSIYEIVVLEPTDGIVALVCKTHPELKNPTRFCLQGATAGGSAVALGIIRVGLCIRMHSSVGLVTTSSVQSVEIVYDESRAKEIVATLPEQQAEISEEEFQRICDEKIALLPQEHRQWIVDFIKEFCRDGKIFALSAMTTANETGKMSEVITVLENIYDEHWGYRPPPCRGAILTESDCSYWDEVYRRLGIKPPGPR